MNRGFLLVRPIVQPLRALQRAVGLCTAGLRVHLGRRLFALEPVRRELFEISGALDKPPRPGNKYGKDEQVPYDLEIILLIHAGTPTT